MILRRNEIMKKAVKITVNILAWIVLVFALLITLIVFSSEKNNGVSNIFGYMPLTVESDSMSPTFKKGDMILCKEIDDVNDLKKDDVITFWTLIDGKRVKNTHRIVEVNNVDGSVSFITRGDNNSADDEVPAYSSDIIGKWTDVKISGFGKVLDFLKTKKGFFICIIIPLAVFFLFELYKFIATIIEVKNGDKSEKLDEEEIKRRAIEEYLAEKKKSEEAAESAADTAEKIAETAEKAAEKTADTAEKAADTAEKTAEKTAETATEAAEKAEEIITGKTEEAVEEAAAAVNEASAETGKEEA
jgi:signal peptidase